MHESAFPHLRFYARNERLEFNVPYDYEGQGHSYQPDFLVQLEPGRTLILEIKGQEDDQDHAKHEAARRRVRAVNRWGALGKWRFEVCKAPNELQALIAKVRSESWA